jgi:sulfur carrier protein
MAMMNPTMTITLNGSPHELAGPLPLTALLDALGLAGKPVVVELNEVAVRPSDYPASLVTAGARVEIVTLAAGG